MTEEPQEVQDPDTTGPTTLPPDENPPDPSVEPPDEEPEDEPSEPTEPPAEEPAEEPAPPEGKTSAEWEKVFKEVDRLRKDTARRVGNIFGEEATALMDCPLCLNVAPGYLWPPDVAPLDEQQVTAIRMLLNMPVATDYVQSDAYEPCPKCAALGNVRTGSKVQNQEIVTCQRCQGRGYIPTAIGPVPVDNGNGHEQDAGLTGPGVYGHDVQPAADLNDPAIQALTDRGFMVLPPLAAPRPAS